MYKSLFVLLFLLALSCYDSTQTSLRKGQNGLDFFTAFWQLRVAGLGFFDLVLTILFLFALTHILSTMRIRRSRFDKLLIIIVILTFVGSINRFFYETSGDLAANLFFRIRDSLYLLLAYYFASRIKWSEDRFIKYSIFFIAMDVMVTMIGLLQGMVTSGAKLWKYGHYIDFRDFQDVAFMQFSQFFIVGAIIEKVPKSRAVHIFAWVITIYMLYNTFTGVGKTALISYPLYLAYYVWYYKSYKKPWFKAVAASLVFIILGLSLYVMRYGGSLDYSNPLYVYSTFRSDDPSVYTRIFECGNTYYNLVQRNAVVQGIGLGVKWYEYLPQPPDGGAWPPDEQGAPWHFGMHVPFARLLLDFGLLGGGILLYGFIFIFRETLKALRKYKYMPITIACLHAYMLVCCYLLFFNNLTGPKNNLINGLIIGMISGLITSSSKNSNVKNSDLVKGDPL